MKKKYMIAIKRLMLWHFNSADIRETLEDISFYFDSALENGISEGEAAKQYGKVEDTVYDLIKNNPKSDSKNKKIRAKFLAITAILAFVAILPENFSRALMPLATAVFFWFISGNSCLIGIVPHTKNELNRFVILQILILCLFTVIQTCTIFFVPVFLRDTLDGKSIIGIIYVTIFILLAIVAISALDMFNGNLYMFFVLIQSISLICDLIWYRKFLFSIVTLESTKFVFYAYLLSVPLMIFWWIACHMKKKTLQSAI